MLFLATRKRPDLSCAVSLLETFAASRQPPHWNEMKHVVTYLKGTACVGLMYRKRCETNLVVWSDADWACDCSTRRSRSGFVVMIGNNAVSWFSRLQTSIAMSAAGAEFCALSECVRQVQWIRIVMCNLGIERTSAAPLFQDNLGAIGWTQEFEGLRKVRFVGIRYHCVKEAVQKGNVSVLFTTSWKNKADRFTKAVVGSDFSRQCSRIGLLAGLTRGGMLTNENVMVK